MQNDEEINRKLDDILMALLGNEQFGMEGMISKVKRHEESIHHHDNAIAELVPKSKIHSEVIKDTNIMVKQHDELISNMGPKVKVAYSFVTNAKLKIATLTGGFTAIGVLALWLLNHVLIPLFIPTK